MILKTRRNLFMNLLPITAAIFCLCLMPPVANAGWFGPSNYSECVEKYVKKAKCNRAAIILAITCRMQFDENKQSSEWGKYYDCVRDNLEDVEQDQAAVVLTNSCKKKYPQLFYIDQ